MTQQVSLIEKAAQMAFNLPSVVIAPHFDYEPNGPFIVFGNDYFKHDMDDLTDAFDELFRYTLPPTPDRTCGIMDRDGVIVIGYNQGSWFGVEAGFDRYRDHPLTHPLEYELAVDEARENRE